MSVNTVITGRRIEPEKSERTEHWQNAQQMKRLLPWLITVMVVAGICRAFPPFHIRSLKQVKADIAGATFNPKSFVEQFWSGKLLPATEQAADAAKVLEVIAAGPQTLRDQFGRTVGVSSSYFLFLRGTGRVISIDADNVGLSLKPEGSEADIVVPLGLVFGNAVRDGTGLLNASSYPNAQEFNDISAGLNHIVETQVLPELQRIAAPGKRVRFAGCVEVADADTDLKPLKLVPVFVKLE
jgi:predicted lipoprotein